MKKVIPHSRPTLGDAEATAVAAAVRSGFVGSGEQVAAFEKAVCQYTEQSHAIATSSGSAALLVALLAAGVTHGDEVIIPAFVCRAVLNAVLNSGAKAVLADIHPRDLTISPADVERRITTKCKAIVVVHMFGAPADFTGILELSKKHPGITVIEDAASSLGARSGGGPVGSLGNVAVLSFASTKMITSGQGGMVLGRDAGYMTKVRELMDYDCDSRENQRRAFNYQMSDVQGALGLVQFRRLPEFVEVRSAIAARYSDALAGSAIKAVEVRSGAASCHYRFVIAAGDRTAAIQESLRSQAIDARTGVAHLLYDYMGIPAAEFPGAESVRGQLLSIPVYPSLSDEEMSRICSALGEAVDE